MAFENRPDIPVLCDEQHVEAFGIPGHAEECRQRMPPDARQVADVHQLGDRGVVAGHVVPPCRSPVVQRSAGWDTRAEKVSTLQWSRPWSVSDEMLTGIIPGIRPPRQPSATSNTTPSRLYSPHDHRRSAASLWSRLSIGCAAATCPAATRSGRSPHAPADGAVRAPDSRNSLCPPAAR